MNKHKDKSNGSEQKGATAVAERSTERLDGRDEILAYRRPLVPSGWMGDAFPTVRRLADEFDRVFEGFGFGGNSLWGNSLLRSPWSTDAGTGSWMPPVEVLWRGDRLVVRADLPGVAKDDIQVEVMDGAMSIRGQRRAEHEENRDGFYCSERSYGSFSRTILLPEGAEADKADVNFRDGVLEITIPAQGRQERQRHRLEVKG
jgi:HSP20 family protein